MGSYAHCWLENFLIGSSKNDIDPSLMSLFRSSDKRIVTDPNQEIPTQLKHYQENQLEDPELKIVYYKANAVVIRERLNVLGYTLENANYAFLEWFKGQMNSLQEYIDKERVNEKPEKFSLSKIYGEEIDLITDITPEIWLDALNEIRKSKIEPNYYGRYEGPHEKTIIGYMLSNEWYGFPGFDIKVPLRIILENANLNDNLIYDVTDLVWSEYFEDDEDLIEYSLQVSIAGYNSMARTIILTEGKTDTLFLKDSLQLLYPHLVDYYSFLEFDDSRLGGGVGNLANITKAFSGAGIVNNIIALFDNDTAAASAVKNFKDISLPPNIKILKLPEIELLNNYPTIGPSGNVSLNVNGIAASIELYFGRDILKIDGVNLAPIQWTGYDSNLKKYQGEVIDKKILQERFVEKIKQAKSSNSKALDDSWDDMRSILDMIFRAFVENDKNIIISLARDYYSS